MTWHTLKCSLSDYHNSLTVPTVCCCWVMMTVWKVTGVQQLDNITAWSLWQCSCDCTLLSYSDIQVGCLSRLLTCQNTASLNILSEANVIVILIIAIIKWWRANGSSKWTWCNPNQTKIKSLKDYQAAQHNILRLTQSIMLN